MSNLFSIAPSTAKTLTTLLFIFGSSGLCRYWTLNYNVMYQGPYGEV